jgi:hypothetical protein
MLHFSHNQSNWSSPSFSSTTFQNFPCISGFSKCSSFSTTQSYATNVTFHQFLPYIEIQSYGEQSLLFVNIGVGDCWILQTEFTVPFPAQRLRCQTQFCFPTINETWVRYVRFVRIGKLYNLRIVTSADLWSQITDTAHPLTYNSVIILLAAFLNPSLRQI